MNHIQIVETYLNNIFSESPDLRASGIYSDKLAVQAPDSSFKEHYSNYQVKTLISEGDKICAVYECYSKDPDFDTLTVTDVLEIADGKIQKVTQNYDASHLKRLNSHI